MKKIKQNMNTKIDDMEPPTKKQRKDANIVVKAGKKLPGKASKAIVPEKPDWTELKKKKKELRVARKQKECNVYEIASKSKRAWEKLRRTDCPKEKKGELINEIHKLLRTNLLKVVFSHDMARIVQWVLKLGTPEIRSEVVQELKPALLRIVQSKYSQFCVKKILVHGSAEDRNIVIHSFYGNVVRLLNHTLAAPLVEYAYNMWANAKQKAEMQQEFYGDMYKRSKDDTVHGLVDAWKSSPGLKDAILASTKSSLTKLLSKKLVNSSLVHTVMYDYLTQCSLEDRSEMLAEARSSLLELSRTKYGVRVAMMCFWYGTTKERKNGMKSIKEHVTEVATSEHGHLLLLSLFDCIDDTVLLKKILLSEVTKNAIEIAGNEYGRRVILYLVAHRDPHYFHPAEVGCLKEAESKSESKKNPEIREAELVKAVSQPLLESVSSCAEKWMSSNSMTFITLAVLKAGEGSKLQEAFQSIVKYISNPDNRVKDGEEDRAAIEHTGIHMMLKKLLQNDKTAKTTAEDSFSAVLVSAITEETIKWWTNYNRGCFLLVLVLECGINTVVEQLEEKFTPSLLQHIKHQKSPGSKILLKNLKKKNM